MLFVSHRNIREKGRRARDARHGFVQVSNSFRSKIPKLTHVAFVYLETPRESSKSKHPGVDRSGRLFCRVTARPAVRQPRSRNSGTPQPSLRCPPSRLPTVIFAASICRNEEPVLNRVPAASAPRQLPPTTVRPSVQKHNSEKSGCGSTDCGECWTID